MKNIVVVIIAVFFAFGLTLEKEKPRTISDNVIMCSGSLVKRLVYERNDDLEKAGKCTGKANCRVCSDCSLCGHCNSGGSCGVCSGGRAAKTYIPPPRPSSTSNASTSRYPKKETEPNSYYEKKPTTSDYRATGSTTRSKSNYMPGSDYTYIPKQEYKVKGSVVNIRKGPSTTNEVIGQLKYGELLTAKRRTNDETYIPKYGRHYWYFVDYYGGSGWIYGGLVEDVNDTAARENEKSVKGNDVNVRNKPSTTAGKRLFKLDINDKVLLLGPKENYEEIGTYGYNYWYKIRCDKGDGWIYGGLIR